MGESGICFGNYHPLDLLSPVDCHNHSMNVGRIDNLSSSHRVYHEHQKQLSSTFQSMCQISRGFIYYNHSANIPCAIQWDQRSLWVRGEDRRVPSP
jgi:hypothetical protein